MPGVDQLRFGRSTERKPAEDEGPRVKGKLLGAVFSLFSNQLNRLHLPQPAFADSGE